MELIDIVLLGLLIIITCLLVIILLQLFKRKDDKTIQNELSQIKNDINTNIKTEYSTMTDIFTNLFNVYKDSQERQISQMSQTVETLIKHNMENQTKANLETEQKLENIRNTIENSINNLRESTEIRLQNVRETVDRSLTKINEDNSKKLDEMRQIVDEKLQSTLNARIAESFRTVSESLEKVTRGLGEMQSLASNVGDLKRVLTNVKTRGTFGEIQLGNILEDILNPDQYETNVITKRGSNDRVEFAIKLPGDGKPVYLPIDSKFPLDDYYRLQDAYDKADPLLVEKAKKDLATKIKMFAKDISSKYIDVPNTTEFAIMFLPTEGLYAEVVTLGLVEDLQRDYKINIAGPTTMAALLNSIQMGFKTLAIQKHTSEVWQTLAKVKTEFEKFGKVLESAQNRLKLVNKDLNTLIGTRTRKIQRVLENVTTYTYSDNLLPDALADYDDSDEEDENEE